MTNTLTEIQADMAARSLPDLFEAVEAGLAHAERAVHAGKGVDLSPLHGLISALCAQLAMADRAIGRSYIDAAGRLVDSLTRLEGSLVEGSLAPDLPPKREADPVTEGEPAPGTASAAEVTQSATARIARFHQVYAAAAATQALKKGH